MRTRGVTGAGLKLVIWGQPGMFKTSFAARLPKPLFVDPCGGTARMNVERETVDSRNDIAEVLCAFEVGAGDYKDFDTLVLDEFTEIERLYTEWYCKSHNKKTLGEFGHGQGYFGLREEMASLLRTLGRISASGKNVVVIGHSICKTHLNPDGPDYDKFVSTNDRVVWSNVYQFSDTVLFAGQRVAAVEKDGKVLGITGAPKLFARAQALFDAKNRFNMPASIANNREATGLFLDYVEGTKLLGQGELAAAIKSFPNSNPDNYQDSMDDTAKVQCYVFEKNRK